MGQNFSALIIAAPATFGLLAPDAVAISAVVVAFTNALAIARDPSTRTTVTVNIKGVARWAAEAVIRPYAMQIKAFAGITDANKIAVGVGVRDANPSPISAPITCCGVDWPDLSTASTQRQPATESSSRHAAR